MPNSSYLTIDLKAVEENFLFFSRKTGAVMPMVKARSYGTDALRLSRFFEKHTRVPYLGVSHVNEGIALRKAGIELPIFVINAPPFEAEKTAAFRLSPAVSTLEEAQALEWAAAKEKIVLDIHVNVNTGMNRFGARPEQALDLTNRIRSMPHLQIEGVMTHFAASESTTYDAFSQEQIDLFERFVSSLSPRPRWVHAANSAGALRFDLPFCNLSRIGLALFGLGPFSSPLKPALSLETHLASIANCRQGESVGYERTFFLQKDTRIGVIPFGYHDGLHRKFSGKGHVLIRGKKAPFTGMVCMDFTMIDLSEIPEAAVGDSVTLFDQVLRPETVAAWGSTDVREVLACLGPRVKRVFKYPTPSRKKDDKACQERLPRPLCTIEKDPSS